jgi:hypothetical protein
MFGWFKRRSPPTVSGVPDRGQLRWGVAPLPPEPHAGFLGRASGLSAPPGAGLVPLRDVPRSVTERGAAQQYPARRPLGNRGYMVDVTSTRREVYSRAFSDNGGDAYTWSPVLRGKNGLPYRRVVSKTQRLGAEMRTLLRPGRGG